MPDQTTRLFVVYDGTALPDPVYRAVSTCPPRLDDFRSHDSLGLPYRRVLFVRAVGISVFSTPQALNRARKRFNLAHATAALDLHIAEIAWAETGRPDHLTVWAAPSVLLDRVLQCEHAH